MHNGIYGLAVLILLTGFAAHAESGEKTCPAAGKRINDSNNLIMLSGTAKGNIRMVVGGMVGKDLDEQARSSIRFDVCGVLDEEAYDYHKTENGLTLNMSNHIVRADGGWDSVYDIAIIVNRNGQQRLVNHKQGKTRFFLGKNGVITSATDAFTIDGEPGFTTTIYSYDKQLRLVQGTARGSDPLSNDLVDYAYDKNGFFSSSTSSNGKTTYQYDAQGREKGSYSISRTAISQNSKREECQRNDAVGNCILSYGRETEILPKAIIHRHRSTATQYQYWP
ncbi:hypothetical protein ACL2XP_20455 [Sodalis sp. RH21]|uniref:hypothetical protein n=1 Tax=unclassified Sodalis (in: enterobacteria) TaxID=2636512 RepID=UPI0039B38990